MGWFSGTPKWFDKVRREWPDNIPAPQVSDELERLRLARDVSHDDFAMIYMWCWWHNEVALRVSYVMLKRAKPGVDEKDYIATVFASLATKKIGLWYRDQEEIVQTFLKLESLEDVINELHRKHRSWADSFLTAGHKHLMGAIEIILEKNKKSMEELFLTFDQSMGRR